MILYKGKNDKAFHIALLPLLSVIFVSVFPFILNVIFNIDFSVSENGTVISSTVTVAFNVLCITLALLTVLLCYIDFLARKDVSSPILGISLLSACIIDGVAVLYESRLIESIYPNQPIPDVSSFIGLFSRTFHASSLLVGVLVFIAQSPRINTGGVSARQFVGFMSLILVLITSLVAVILVNNDYFPRLLFPNDIISRPFELLPFLIYVFLGVALMPKFYKLYPSVFSQALFLSLIPASVLQLHLSIGSTYYFDNDYMVAYFLRATMYFIPFGGIAFNYYATVNNERKVINDLHVEAANRGKAEQMLSSIFNTSPSGIIAYSAIRNQNNQIDDFSIELYNETAKIYNIHYNNWENGKMSELFSNNWENGLFDQYVNVVENNEVMDEELYVESMDSWFRIAARKRGENGITVVFNDITRIKNYEADLVFKVTELNRSNKELEEFAYIASHDLQEPLRKIRTFADRILEVNANLLDEKSDDYLHRMNDAAHRMQTLIGDLMEYSRAGKNNSDNELIPIEEIWKDVIVDLDMLIEQKNAKITYSNLPVLKVNKLKMHQLFYNLLNNSLKFSAPDRTPEISLHYSIQTLMNELNGKRTMWHTFAFTDNGIGFNQEYSDKIFLLFQRLHGKNEYAGSGIGLSVCKKIVENMEGTISVKSKENEGTEFIIKFPQY